MKKQLVKTKVLILALVMSFALGMLPQRAEALLILDPYGLPNDGGSVITCILLLPLCILGGQANITQVSSQDLRDNGYSETQISNILQGQTEVFVYMKEHKMTTSAQMSETIEAIKTTLNADYLEFVDQNQ